MTVHQLEKVLPYAELVEWRAFWRLENEAQREAAEEARREAGR